MYCLRARVRQIQATSGHEYSQNLYCTAYHIVRKIDFVFKEGSTRPTCKTSHQGDRTRGFFAPCDLIWLLWNYFIYVGHYISWFPSL